MNTINKAQEVKKAYVDAKYKNISSEGCYALAVAAAWELGGVEVYNSNDDGNNRTYSFAPTRTFEFDDGSSVQVTCG